MGKVYNIATRIFESDSTTTFWQFYANGFVNTNFRNVKKNKINQQKQNHLRFHQSV